MEKNELSFPDGSLMPSLCLGTWYLGEKTSRFTKEVDLLREAVAVGIKAFDVAESYNNGGAEEVVGEAFKDCRKNVFLCSKIAPDKAVSYDSIFETCARSLERLQTDYLDMYLLHWYSDGIDLSEALDAFVELKHQGLIKRFGVSNFDADEINTWTAMPEGAQTDENQVLYNLFHRGNKDMVDACRKKHIPVMGYFPYEPKDDIFKNAVLKEVARRRGATPYQVALAWTLAGKNTGVLLQAKSVKDLKKAVNACEIELEKPEIHLLNKTFPAKR